MKTKTYHFVFVVFFYFSRSLVFVHTFYSSHYLLRWSALMLSLPLLLFSSRLLPLPTVIYLFFFYYHLQKIYSSFMLMPTSHQNKNLDDPTNPRTRLFFHSTPYSGLLKPYFLFFTFLETNKQNKFQTPKNILIPNSPTLADGHAWCSLHSLRYVYQFLIHILFDIFSNSFMFCVCWSSLSRALRHVFFYLVVDG